MMFHEHNESVDLIVDQINGVVSERESLRACNMSAAGAKAGPGSFLLLDQDAQLVQQHLLYIEV
jgi:hypothetical protein